MSTFILRATANTAHPLWAAALCPRSRPLSQRLVLTVSQHSQALGLPAVRARGISSTSFTNNLPAKGQQETGLAQTSSDGVVATHPIDFDVASKIEGNESQIVTVALEPGQVLRAESGGMMYMTDGISMETTTGGGMSAGFKRMLTGQNVFISDYRYEGEPGTTGLVALGTDFPS